MRLKTVAAILLTGGVASVVACSTSDSGNGNTADGGAGDDAGNTADAAIPPIALALACADSLDSIYGDPGPLGDVKGAILKCAHERDFTAAELEALARANGYSGRPFTSGAHAYRVVYRTERAAEAPNAPLPGYTSASVLIPDRPRSAQLPVVVAAHGTAGEGGACALSKSTLNPQNPPDPVTVLLTPLGGDGYAAITPDYAGYSNYGAANNPPSGAFLVSDVGKGVLDAARALRALIPTAVSDKVAIVGHSEGGHAALSALSLNESYGAGGTLVGVATYSPLWFNMASWGAMLIEPEAFPLNPPTGGIFPIAVGVWYHYSHGEELDGPGHGLDVFAADKRAAIKTFFDTTCVGGNDADFAQLKVLGTNVADLYDPTFASAIKKTAAFGTPCPTDATLGPLCTKWAARYAVDRPKITGAAAQVPLLVMYGGSDTTIPPERAVCGFERLKKDGVPYSFCFEPGQDHSGIINVRAAYVNDWIANLALNGPAPAACPIADYSIVTEDGGAAACSTPPSND